MVKAKEVNFLIVDDDDLDVEILERSFKKLRIANPMYRAVDGFDALDYLRGTNGRRRLGHPMIILLDINMPRMNGQEFLREIRADAELRKAVVFVLTTSDDERDIIEAYEQHIAGYVVKSRAGDSFEEALKLVDTYWRVVELPP